MDNPFVGKLTIGQTLDRGIRLYKKTFKTVFLLLVLPFALGVFNMKYILVPDPQHPFAFFTPLYFLSMLLGMWSWIVIIRYIYKVSMEETLEFGAIIRLATWSDLFLIITGIIWYIMLILGMVALVVPFFYILNICMVGMVIVIVEKKYFFNGIGRTFSLTKGKWWKTFVINIVTLLILSVPAGIGMYFFFVPIMKSSMNTASGAAPGGVMTPAAVIGMIVYMVIIALVYPLFVTINVVHYNSLKSEKENIDISQQLDHLGETSEKDV
ncbi:MAG: hypothetical protein JW863_18540 [Chitinispirillaceae bacterium]|nr:hypothetical protein [Chitinispirillaceae bacterium]